MTTLTNTDHTHVEKVFNAHAKKKFDKAGLKGFWLEKNPTPDQDPVLWYDRTAKVIGDKWVGNIRVFVIEQTLHGYLAGRTKGKWTKETSNNLWGLDSDAGLYPRLDTSVTKVYYESVGILRSASLPKSIRGTYGYGDSFTVCNDYWRTVDSAKEVEDLVTERAVQETARLTKNGFNFGWYPTLVELSQGLLRKAMPYYTPVKTGFPADVRDAGSNPLVPAQSLGRSLEVGEIVRFYSNGYRYGVITKVGKHNHRIAFVTKSNPAHVVFATRSINGLEVEEGWKLLAKETETK